MYNSLGNISAPVFKLVPFYPNLVSITREKRKITGALRGALFSLPPLPPGGGTPLRGALLFPRGKSNQKDAQGEARRTDAARPQAGPPPENPLVLRGCSIRGIFLGASGAWGRDVFPPYFCCRPFAGTVIGWGPRTAPPAVDLTRRGGGWRFYPPWLVS